MARGPTPTSNAWTAPAVIAAYLLPGMGHIIIGRPVRGIIVMVMVAATFWSGLAIGGVMTIDPQEQRWWFIGQMVTGVHGLYAWHRQAAVYKEALAEAYQDPDFKSMPAPQRMAPGQIDRAGQHRGLRGSVVVSLPGWAAGGTQAGVDCAAVEAGGSAWGACGGGGAGCVAAAAERPRAQRGDGGAVLHRGQAWRDGASEPRDGVHIAGDSAPGFSRGSHGGAAGAACGGDGGDTAGGGAGGDGAGASILRAGGDDGVSARA